MRARTHSLWAKVVAGGILIGSFAATFFGVPVKMDDAIKVAGCIFLLYSDISVNLIVEKIFPTKAA